MKILVTGATGTLGKLVVKRLLSNGCHVVGFSRDEQKQRLMQKHQNLTMVLGDVRDLESLKLASMGCDKIAHFAALKCVDTLEENPAEAIKTNVLGTMNVCTVSKLLGLKVVFTSTDKACEPINAYGHTKALGECLVFENGGTVCRYGNVLGSRGSVVNAFVKSLKEKNEINLTHSDMTRFWITADDAADFVTDKIMHTPTHPGIYIPDILAAPVVSIGAAIATILDIKPYAINIVGIRAGEKLHETLRVEDGDIPGMTSDLYNEYTTDELIEMLDPVVREVVGK